LLTVIDVFEKSEKIIRERELDKSEDSQKAIKRILLAKNKLLNILENNNIRKIEFVNNILNSDKCTVSETMPDSSLPNDYILEILKDGYERNGILLRRAEVVIVKN
jgi:molecular chaperone GrpE (heat shock protein)